MSALVKLGMDGLESLIHTTKMNLPKCRKGENFSFCLKLCRTLKDFFNY